MKRILLLAIICLTYPALADRLNHTIEVLERGDPYGRNEDEGPGPIGRQSVQAGSGAGGVGG